MSPDMIEIKVLVLVLEVEEDLKRGLMVEIESNCTRSTTGSIVQGECPCEPRCCTLDSLVRQISLVYPAFRKKLTGEGGALLPHIKVMAEGIVTHKINFPLTPGSEVVFFPALAGG